MDTPRLKIEKLILIGLVPIFFIFYLSNTYGVTTFIVLSLIFISGLLFVKRLGSIFPYLQQKNNFFNNFFCRL
jgi:hypothetical protein